MNMYHCFRYDWLAKKSLRAGYFVWAMTAYGLGMQEMRTVLSGNVDSSCVYYFSPLFPSSCCYNAMLYSFSDYGFCIIPSKLLFIFYLHFYFMLCFSFLFRTPHYLCGVELDGWTWSTSFTLHCSIHSRYVQSSFSEQPHFKTFC